MIQLRDYQMEALAAERAARAFAPSETRLAIVLATGLGKTIVMGARCVHYLESFEGAGNRVLILVHTDELTSQAETKVRLMVKEAGYTVGVVKAERNEVTADIIVASVQTLSRPERRAQVTDVGLVIVDECHHATAASYQDILRHYGCLPVHHYDEREHFTPALGLTATLERGDGQSLGSIWQDVAYTRGTSWAVRRGYLVQPVGYRLEIPGMELRGTESVNLQDIALVQSLAAERIVAEWQRITHGERQTVAFMPLVRSARALEQAFLTAGIEACVIHGDMPKAARQRALEYYENGTIRVLVNAMVLTEGWDSPSTSCVIIGRPTKSRPLFIQMAGRGLRPDPLKPVEEQDCILLVVADSTTDMCTVADLSDKPIDRKVQGALTEMEDQWDLGADLEDPEHVWLGQVDARQFDPLVARSSKVWKRTTAGTPFLPLGDRRYVFIVGTSIYSHEVEDGRARVLGLGESADLEMAMVEAERYAEDLGGDLGRLVADKRRAWRGKVPSEEMLARAAQLGLASKVEKIMAARAGGKAGKVSDLMDTVLATRTLDRFVKRIKDRENV